VANPEFWQPEVDSIKPEIDATTDINEDEGEEEVKTLEDLQSSINRLVFFSLFYFYDFLIPTVIPADIQFTVHIVILIAFLFVICLFDHSR
jgi:hypothetical protein